MPDRDPTHWLTVIFGFSFTESSNGKCLSDSLIQQCCRCTYKSIKGRKSSRCFVRIAFIRLIILLFDPQGRSGQDVRNP
jgi:hypothetical protein